MITGKANRARATARSVQTNLYLCDRGWHETRWHYLTLFLLMAMFEANTNLTHLTHDFMFVKVNPNTLSLMNYAHCSCILCRIPQNAFMVSPLPVKMEASGIKTQVGLLGEILMLIVSVLQ